MDDDLDNGKTAPGRPGPLDERDLDYAVTLRSDNVLAGRMRGDPRLWVFTLKSLANRPKP